MQQFAVLCKVVTVFVPEMDIAAPVVLSCTEFLRYDHITIWLMDF